MNELWAPIQDLFTLEKSLNLLRAVVLLAFGLFLARVLARVAQRLAQDRLEGAHLALLRRAVFYSLFSLFLIAALKQLGFDLSVLLGAAGIVTVALGFASQTSASNLISGLFLIAERPFEIGDTIQVGSTTGEVLSIDMLSVKLRTFDNLFVRIPNESLIKTEVRTFTKFPIRRADLKIGIAYKEDIERVRDLLYTIADENPLCLDEPKPQFFVLGFGDSDVQLQFSPWALKANYIELKTVMQQQIKQAFDREGIEIPFPHRTLYTGSETAPMPVMLVPPVPTDSKDSADT